MSEEDSQEPTEEQKAATEAALKTQQDADAAKKEAAQKDGAAADAPTGQDAGSDPLAESKELLAKITEQNNIMASNIKKMESIQANAVLSGTIPAGAEKKALTKDDKDTEAARELLKGTGYDDKLFPKDG